MSSNCELCIKYINKGWKMCPKCGNMFKLERDEKVIMKEIRMLIIDLYENGDKPETVAKIMKLSEEIDNKPMYFKIQRKTQNNTKHESNYIKNYYDFINSYSYSDSIEKKLTGYFDYFELESIELLYEYSGYRYLKYFQNWEKKFIARHKEYIANYINEYNKQEKTGYSGIYTQYNHSNLCFIGDNILIIPLDVENKPILSELYRNKNPYDEVNQKRLDNNNLHNLGKIKKNDIIPALIEMFNFDVEDNE